MYTTLVDCVVLHEHLQDWLVLDCRFQLSADGASVDAGRRAYGAGHIPGAFYLHLDDELSSPVSVDSGRHPLPNIEALAARLAALGLTADRQVVVYDDVGGAMAGRAWWLLRWMGHQAVALLDGGFPAWQESGYEVSQKPVAVDAGEFFARIDSRAVLTADQVLERLNDPVMTLIDARSAARFAGEEEPIDPVAGHVPGALNRPMTENLQADGRFKPPGVLHAEWQALLDGIPAEQVVHMCGSGVTACHNLLAMEVAGLTGSRIYPGSWSEWIRDSKRPVATES